MTRSNHPAPGHGWLATPGQPIPRAARQPAANGLLLVILVLVWFSPLSIVAWLLGQAVILLQRRWHWCRFALASLAAIVAVLATVGRRWRCAGTSSCPSTSGSTWPCTSASARPAPR